MARQFSELRSKMSPRAQAEAEALAQQIIEEARLADVRKAYHLTQVTLAQTMGTTQAEISKIEQRTDCLVSTLRNYLEAMNGELEIVARFPDGKTVRITQFGELAHTA